MNAIDTANRTDWLTARRELLEREKAHTREKDEIARARRALPWVRLDKEYVFDTENGTASLSRLFGDCRQLIVYHFMFGKDWEQGCKSCSFWADSFNGLSEHLKARDTASTAISRAPMNVLLPFKKRMGWNFDWVSSASNSFNADFHVGFGPDHPRTAPMMYNYREVDSVPMDEMHGTSVFARDEGGTVYHTYSTYGRGLDSSNAAYSYIDMTPKGRDEPTEGNPMAWVNHHDAY